MCGLPALVLLAQVVLVSSATAQLAKKRGTDIHGDLLPEAAIARLETSRFQLETYVSDIALSAGPNHGRWRRSWVVAVHGPYGILSAVG